MTFLSNLNIIIKFIFIIVYYILLLHCNTRLVPTIPRKSAKGKTEASILSGNFNSYGLPFFSSKLTVHIIPECEPTVANNSDLKINK